MNEKIKLIYTDLQLQLNEQEQYLEFLINSDITHLKCSEVLKEIGSIKLGISTLDEYLTKE